MVYAKPALPREYKRPSGFDSRITKPKQKFSKSHNGGNTRPKNPQETDWIRSQERKQPPKISYEEMMQHAGQANKLRLSHMREGMLVLGCVCNISPRGLHVILPGRVNGIVPITNISAIYSKHLSDMINSGSNDCLTLNDFYTVGDLVYTKVMGITYKKVILSLDPRHLHETFQPSQLVPGLVLSATIIEKADHGYTMDVGVNNVRAFLPQENLNENRDDSGRNLFCSIATVKSSGGVVEATLKAFHPDEPRVLTVAEAAMETIVPGCQVTFTVSEPVEYGLRGMLFEDSVVAYVSECFLTKSSKEKYEKSKRLLATLLYTMPVTNEVFVSLRPYPNNQAEMDPAYKMGTVIKKAYVKRHDAHGNVWLQFGNNRRAFISRKTILRDANGASGGNVDESFVLSNFQVGTTHDVCVVFFDPLENTYIVTANPDCMDDTVKNINDIVIGQTYKCRVIAPPPRVAVAIGNVKAHLKSYLYDNASNLKFRDIVSMRAIGREEGTEFVYFTNHPLLMDDSAPILKDWDQLEAAGEDKTFLGVVCFGSQEHLEVQFFNNMRGRLYTKRPPVGQDMEEVAKLGLGSVKLFTVIGYNREKNQIDLTLKKTDKPDSRIQLPNVTVTWVHALGVNVRDENGEEGMIPADCFSEFGQHNSLYMRLLREGEKLTAVKTQPGKYSVRLTQYFQEHPTKMEDVNPGMVLKANCIIGGEQLFAVPLMSKHTKRIPIPDQPNYRNIVDGSIVKMRVIDFTNREKLIRTREVDVCEDIFVDSHSFINEYMQDVNRLIERYREQGHAFAHYSIGDKVECVVEGIVPEYNKMAISVNAVGKHSKFTTKGIVSTVLPERPASSYSVDQKLSGRVVWIDVEKRLLHVCVDKPLFEHIQLRKEDEPVPKGERECWILFSNYFINICCVKNDPACRLVVVPVKYHYNDFIGDKLDGCTVTAYLNQELGSMILGFESTIYRYYMDLNAAQKNAENRPLELPAETKIPTNISLVRCSTVPATYDEQSDDSEDEAQEAKEKKIPTKLNLVRGSTVPATYDSQSDDSEDEAQEAKEPSDSIDEDEEDELHDDGESDEEVTSLPTSNGNGINKTKKSGSLSSNKNGTKVNGKSMKLAKTEKQVLKRKVDEEDEDENVLLTPATTKEKLLKKKKVTSVEEKKKKKVSVSEEPEMKEESETPKKKKKKASVSEEPKMKEEADTPKKKKKKASAVEEPNKKKDTSMEQPKKKKLAGLKTKTKQFTIDQLDGASDFFLYQLDGTEDITTENTVKKAGVAVKRRLGDAVSHGKRGLPGATNFWDTTPVFKRAVADSSDDEGDSSEEDRNEMAPKKRTTAKERFEAMKQEEERLRKIEEELANPSVDPHTPDQFDRLVLAQPNNSMLWIRYMAFHMEAAELEKARTVGRKALKAIHFREEAERLNVWIALLNLEIRYETVDSFKEVLQEAIQYNDAFKVYTRVVDILIDCQKHAEVQELLELLLKKFRKQNDMWFLVADAWYRIGQGNKVKPLLSQALKSLPTRDHIPLIVKFAFLHNRNENRDEAHLLFEQILTSYPKRTDIWSQYVDMLVKDNLVENARQILERAIMQRLPMKNMKTLYTKYVNFEEKHGDRERVRRVKQLAAEYVQAQLNNAGVK